MRRRRLRPLRLHSVLFIKIGGRGGCLGSPAQRGNRNGPLRAGRSEGVTFSEPGGVINSLNSTSHAPGLSQSGTRPSKSGAEGPSGAILRASVLGRISSKSAQIWSCARVQCPYRTEPSRSAAASAVVMTVTRAKIANFSSPKSPNLAYLARHYSAVSSLTYRLFGCFASFPVRPERMQENAADGGISMSKTSKTHFSTAQKYPVGCATALSVAPALLGSVG